MLVSFLAMAALAGTGLADPAPLLMRHPTTNGKIIVFQFAGDLWSVPVEGGSAVRITNSPGMEEAPIFSPDGRTMAFTGEYDGNVDVYVIPSACGVPKRLTYHPGADVAVGWTPDGKRILFRSSRESFSFFNRLYTIPAEGETGVSERLPLPMAQDGSLSPDGARLAYVPNLQWQAAWKRYRGGQTTPIWIATLADSSIVKVPRDLLTLLFALFNDAALQVTLVGDVDHHDHQLIFTFGQPALQAHVNQIARVFHHPDLAGFVPVLLEGSPAKQVVFILVNTRYKGRKGLMEETLFSNIQKIG
jgi:WD40 repeat protein